MVIAALAVNAPSGTNKIISKTISKIVGKKRAVCVFDITGAAQTAPQ